MNGVVGAFARGYGKQVERMMEMIAHRGKGQPRIIESQHLTLGVVWTPQRSLREASFKQPCLDKAYATIYRQQAPTLAELGRENLPFVLVVDTPEGVYLARDAFGIRPLYYGQGEDGVFYFASEVKALLKVTSSVHEFPPGYLYHAAQGWQQFSEWKYHETSDLEPGLAANELRQKLDRAVDQRVEGEIMGCWLSGGVDSSAIAALARPKVKELHTFVGGIPGAADLENGRLAASYLETIHHEVHFGVESLLEALPKVIWSLESFDALLVRSSIAHYLVSQVATDFVDSILSGEGGDELFAGYAYLQEIPREELHEELINISSCLHNTALQRVDRCASAFGLTAHVPFLDREVVEFVMRLPTEYKLPADPPHTEKWILRKAVEGLLPDQIVHRPKEKFWAGAGIKDLLAKVADERITDADFVRERRLPNGWQLTSKEELMYYRIFREQFGDVEDLNWMGRTKLTSN